MRLHFTYQIHLLPSHLHGECDQIKRDLRPCSESHSPLASSGTQRAAMTQNHSAEVVTVGRGDNPQPLPWQADEKEKKKKITERRRWMMCFFTLYRFRKSFQLPPPAKTKSHGRDRNRDAFPRKGHQPWVPCTPRFTSSVSRIDLRREVSQR